MDESPILAFYRGHGADHAGRRLTEILGWDHRRLEMIHDYIQWLFPLPQPSRFNSAAPLLTDHDIAIFRADPALQQRALDALDRLLDFWGLTRTAADIVRAKSFAARAPGWLSPANHNHLRLTRVLLFLRLTGLDAQARALLTCLEEIAAHEGQAAISPRTLAFWRDAVLGGG
jgi:hypothetical protein